MQMRRRLKTIASLVDKGSNVIDVGCDHALLDIYLTLYNSNTCIASDINKNAYQIAKTNIEKYNLTDKIKLVCSDGFKQIEMNDRYTAIICGMGTTTILDILKDRKIQMVDSLIIQTNNDIYTIRKQVTHLGFYIQNEIIVKERGIFYVIIKFVRGKKHHYTWKQLYLGPVIHISKSQEKQEYIQFLIHTNDQILEKLPKKYYIKKWKLKYINKLLKKEL